MKIHPEQLVPGCLLTKDVMGNAIHPLIPADTVVEPIHIRVLQRFRIQTVTIAPRLVNGELFKAQEKETSEIEDRTQAEDEDRSAWTFYDYYADAVKQTKVITDRLIETNQLELEPVRKLLHPLLTHPDDRKRILLKLHHYTDKHQYIYHHMVAMAVIASSLAMKMGYGEGDQLKVGLAAYLSDMGMFRDGVSFYLKEAKLTDEEFEQVKKHPVTSYRLIEHVPHLSKDIKLAVLQHHERLDGSGYPLGLKQEKIHPFANIIAVSDTFHAMTSERLYRRKQSPYKVVEELLQRLAGILDMKAIDALIQDYLSLEIGMKVRLSNRDQGTIVFINDANPARPFVKQEEEDKIIDLNEHRDLYIEEVLDNEES